jgi:hypothetical protein
MRTFEIVDLLAASAQTVIHMLCESISMRLSSNLGDRGRRGSVGNSTLLVTPAYYFHARFNSHLI